MNFAIIRRCLFLNGPGKFAMSRRSLVASLIRLVSVVPVRLRVKSRCPPQVSVFMNDVKGDMPLQRECDGGQAVACFFVGSKSPRFVGSDFSAESIKIFIRGVH